MRKKLLQLVALPYCWPSCW